MNLVLLSVSGVRKAFGLDLIMDGVSFRMQAKEKVALVGRNGCGKTTLLKILTGRIEPDEGTVQLARGASVGYLRQEAPVGLGRTVLQEAESVLGHRLELAARLEELERRLEDSPSEADLEEYALVQEHFLEAEGYSAERDVRSVLLKMGFEEHEFDRPTDRLSGGEKTRLALARILLEEPDLLILDEPTNHLDLQATEWLENWVRGYHGAVLLVSHDRAFLDATAGRVVELRRGKAYAYPGPFEKYRELRAEEFARQAIVAERQADQIAKLDEYVRRFMNSQRTAQARGRQKLMNRLLETQAEAPKEQRGMKATLKSAQRSGDRVLEMEKVSAGFPGTTLIEAFDWTVRAGERWGVVGENGAGKSTLIKVALGGLAPLEGRVRLGSNVLPGYFAQDVSDLDPQRSPLDVMVYECDLLPADARNVLGRFLFEGDDAFRAIGSLSGGEKNKLALARLTVAQPNLLVLDEPTNHLDMDSREALAEVLREYDGTLIVISHDRWLLSQIATATLDVRKGGVRSYPGSYEEYRARERAQAASSSASAAKAKAPFVGRASDESTLSPREISKRIGTLRKEIESLEERIGAAETELGGLEAQLASPPTGADLVALSQEHQSRTEGLQRLMEDWGAQNEALEDLMRRQGV